jgi:hypothetical protein
MSAIEDMDIIKSKALAGDLSTSTPELDLDYKLKEVDQSDASVDTESVEKRKSSNVYSVIASGAALVR